ncbi:MAG: efflux RND transporter permease subunit [Clostridia bacterium]|nr:efflux RND transporter permease subunit [Clostridia bacterium]
MGLIKLAIRRPVTILMVVLIILIFGFVSFTNIPIDMMPKMDLPYVIVMTTYSGAGPYEVESLVTKPIEGAVAAVSGIENISSTSSEGSSLVIIEFSDGVDLDFSSIEVREKIDLISRALPSDISSPMIIKMNPNIMPIAAVAVTDSERNAYELTDLVDDTIVPNLERIVGVASVSAYGKSEQEVKVVMNPDKMLGYGINSATIMSLLASENINSVGGTVEYGDRELNVRSMGEIKDVSEIKSLPIPLATGGYIRLSDVADVYMGDVQRTSYSRINGHSSVMLSIQKQTDGNTVEVAKRVKAELDSLKMQYPTTNFTFSYDSSESIEKSIASVAHSAVTGAILAVFVLLIFLKRIKSSLVIAVSIPISVITTFILIYFSGTTINMISLGGLSLGVGMLVDNSIVVLENITRHFGMGYSSKEAAERGAGQVIQAIVASTLTTIIVFVPIVFVKGIAGQIFRDMSLTVAFSLAASLLVALSIVPMMFAKLFKRKKEEQASEVVEISELEQHEMLLDEYRNKTYTKVKFLNAIVKAWDKLMLKIYDVYDRALSYALRKKKRTVIISVLLLIASLASVAVSGFELYPASDEGSISISIETPKDAQLEEINDVTMQVEKIAMAIPEADRVSASTGGYSAMGSSGNASVTLLLVDVNERERSTTEVAEEVRGLVKGITGANITVSEGSSYSMGGGGSGNAVNINIKGPDDAVLEGIAEQVVYQISSIQGIRNPSSSASSGKPEARVYIDRQKAMSYGLSGSQVASSVRLALTGTVATTIKNNGTEIDVRLMYPENVNATLDQLKYVNIRTARGEVIPLESVADIVEGTGPTTVSRQNQQRYISVTAQSYGRDTGSINREVMMKLAGMKLPDGYSFDTGGGTYANMMDSFSQLGKALLLAVVLVYMIMAAQFESLLYPFVVIFSIPFAGIGAFLLNFFAGQSINMVTMIGFIMLAGIVVNNAIVLVDYVNQLRRQKGMSIEDALKAAGPIRLRPILMTALTTILGLLPMALALDESGAMMQPLALTVIGGLITSTISTLVIVPIVYSTLAQISTREGRAERRRQKEEKWEKKQARKSAKRAMKRRAKA